MEDLVLVAKLQRIITQRHEDIVTAMASGAVDNMEKYQYMLGQIRTYQYLLQEMKKIYHQIQLNYLVQQVGEF
jgi:hypothetical protein